MNEKENSINIKYDANGSKLPNHIMEEIDRRILNGSAFSRDELIFAELRKNLEYLTPNEKKIKKRKLERKLDEYARVYTNDDCHPDDAMWYDKEYGTYGCL